MKRPKAVFTEMERQIVRKMKTIADKENQVLRAKADKAKVSSKASKMIDRTNKIVDETLEIQKEIRKISANLNKKVGGLNAEKNKILDGLNKIKVGGRLTYGYSTKYKNTTGNDHIYTLTVNPRLFFVKTGEIGISSNLDSLSDLIVEWEMMRLSMLAADESTNIMDNFKTFLVKIEKLC